VTVVVAVYNTMPYLTECLNSLAEQTIGHDRLEVVAVDDGSTDGSPQELARFAALYPGVFRVISQANSGGPAAPSNRALDVATGRYVFFLGSDDYLGPEALERMVAAADEHGTDVVVAKMVGVNGRWVPEAVFERTRHDATLRNSPLPWALSNTKLFRRSLIEEHGLRYPEDLPILSDQPFTLEACFRAGGISILNDYDYYYAVRRGDEGNVTYRGSLEDRLTGTARIMRLTQRFTETADERYGLNRRHLTSEMSFVLGSRLLDVDPAVQKRIVTGARPLLKDFASDALLGRLPLQDRVHLMLARIGDTDELRDALRFEAAHEDLPLTVVDGRAYLAYPFVNDRRFAAVSKQVDQTETVLKGLGEGVVSLVQGASPVLQISATGPAPRMDALVKAAFLECARKGGSSSERNGSVSGAPEGDGSRLIAALQLDPLVREASGRSATWTVRTRLDTAVGPRHITAAGPSQTALRIRRGLRLHRVTASVQSDGTLTLVISPIRPGRVIAQRLRRLRATGRN
jgi:glycosyltransferase involved in cell wall biosynthesis